MKKMKKINKLIYMLIAFLILSIQSVIPESTVKAKTLMDLKNELSEKQQEYENQKANQQYTEKEIQNVNQRIGAIMTEKSEIEKEIVDLNNEIVELNAQIVKKNEEIKNILDYYQISSTGNTAYLEFLFKSKTFSDFIYRMAVAEQLSEYNSNLIVEYNDLIVKNEEKKVELNQKSVELANKQNELEGQMAILQSNLATISDAQLSTQDEIDILKEYIDVYQNQYNCGDYDDLDYCSRDKLPPGTAFFRPIDEGTVTADFGWYTPWGELIGHNGTDFGGMAHGSNVYSIADGRVAAIWYRSNCGGNMVFIHHYVGGVTYTSLYAHLASINVNVGDIVTPNSVIGFVGGNPYIETWDGCSTGTHVHLQTAYGLYLEDYTSWAAFTSRSFDSRLIVNMPYQGQWISGRDIKY